MLYNYPFGYYIAISVGVLSYPQTKAMREAY